MKKYPVYTDEQSKQWGNLFDTLKYDDFYHHIFSKLYHKGYCYFYKSENIYKEVIETLYRFVPSVPYEIRDVDNLTVEIDIQC